MVNTENLENKTDVQEQITEITPETKEAIKNFVIETVKEQNQEILDKANSFKNEQPQIKVGKEDLNDTFKSFMLDVKKTGVTVPLPAQYIPEIVPAPGVWGLKQYCNNVGTLNSDVLYISRTVTSPTPYWNGLTGGGTSTTVSATLVSVNAKELIVKCPIYDYQINMGMFNALQYFQREAQRVMPKYEDIQIMTGTGAPFTGFYGDSEVPTVSMSATGAVTNLAIGDLRNMVAQIDPGYRTPELKWYVDVTEEQTLLGVADANNALSDIVNGTYRILGYDVVPVSSGVLNGATTTTTASKHFILANLKEGIDYATGDFGIEAIRADHGLTNYYVYAKLAFGVRDPYAGCILKLHA